MDTKIDLERLEQQAKLSIPPEKRAGVEQELRRLLDFAGALGDTPDEGNPPDTRRTVLREDEVRPSMPREALLGGAPAQKDGCILLPRVIEQEE